MMKPFRCSCASVSASAGIELSLSNAD
jgi:hypothetical protein